VYTLYPCFVTEDKTTQDGMKTREVVYFYKDMRISKKWHNLRLKVLLVQKLCLQAIWTDGPLLIQ